MIKWFYICCVILIMTHSVSSLKEITCISVLKDPTIKDLKCYFNFDTIGSESEFSVIVDQSFNDDENRNVKEIVFKVEKNFKLPTEIFQQFSNLEVLRIKPPGLNHLSRILSNAKNLVKLDMDFNGLTKLQSKTFMGAENLRFLQLMWNGLKKIHHDAFFGLSNLQFLYLQNNQLESLHDHTFKPLINLESLDLSQNKLDFLSKNLFKHNLKLSYLSLAFNKVHVTVETVFSELKFLKVLNLSSNICVDQIYDTPGDNFTAIERDLKACLD